MDESTVETKSGMADKPMAERREEIASLGIALREEERTLHDMVQKLDAAEAMAHLVVPRNFRGTVSQGWLAQGSEATHNPNVGDPYVQAFVEDLSTYAALDGMRSAIQTLLANNRRFGMVLDLILAAMPLVEMSTRHMAKSCVDLHMRQCQTMKQRLYVLLTDFPRSRSHWSQRFSGPVA